MMKREECLKNIIQDLINMKKILILLAIVTYAYFNIDAKKKDVGKYDHRWNPKKVTTELFA